MTFGPALRRLRMAANVRVTACANAAGLSPGYLSDIEAGTKPAPRSEARRRIYSAAGLPDERAAELEALAHAERCPHCDALREDGRRGR